MLNLQIFLNNPVGAHSAISRACIDQDMLKGYLSFTHSRVRNSVKAFRDWVLVARRKSDPNAIMFYSINAAPEHGRHGFGSDYNRALRFSDKDVMLIFRVCDDLNKAPARNVNNVLYPAQALSEAFNLSWEELQTGDAYFQLIEFNLSLD